MIRLATVLVADSGSPAAEPLLARLGHNGYHVIRAETAEQALALTVSEHPDLVLLGELGGIQTEIGARIKADSHSADIPVVVMTETVRPDLALAVLEAGLDDLVAWDYDDVELMARLKPLMRLATMHAELRHRAEAAKGFGVDARSLAAGAGAARPSILVVGQDRDGIVAVLGDCADIVTSVNLYDAESLLESRNFDAAVVSSGPDIEGYLAFASQVRNNPRLFNLPLVMVADKTVPAADLYRRGASRVMARPMDAGILRASVLSLVRRQQLRWSIRAALFESLTEATRDPLTGVYGRAFLDAYLAERLAMAKAHDRQLAVVFFYIPNIEAVREHFGDDASEHLAQQLGQWITGLLRAEDLTALYAQNQFCVVLPDTPLVEAEVVMHRIAGVLAYTDFAVRDVYQPIKVWVQVASTAARDDDTLDGLLARVTSELT